MTRRNFIKWCVSLLGVYVAPFNPTKKSVSHNTDALFTIKNKIIKYIGPTDNNTQVSILEFHRFLQNCADNGEPTEDIDLCIIDPAPSIRYSDQHIELINEYTIDEKCVKYLTHGVLVEKSEDGEILNIWSNVQ